MASLTAYQYHVAIGYASSAFLIVFQFAVPAGRSRYINLTIHMVPLWFFLGSGPMKQFMLASGFLIPFLGASTAGAGAADLQIRGAPAFMAPPAFSWTGFYVGGNLGAGIGTTETSVNVGPALTALSGMSIAATAPLVSETFNGFVGGIQGGYNWQAGVFVLGVEGELDAAGLQGTAPCALVLNCTMKHSWFADITGRVGVVAIERTLIYLKGGVAWEGSNFTVGNNINIAGTTVAAGAGGSGTQIGGLLGMGVEYAFLPNWSAKLEYNYIDFGTRSFNASIAANAAFAGTGLAPLAGVQVPASIAENEHIIKAGVNYRF
jgi:outer membrane immunogenic protein